MDEIVKAAMAKWPNVPDCFGWLALDARGHWYMRDDRVQAAGPFSGEGACSKSRGARLEHAALLSFIARNYAADEEGRWFFQNGPQRVYVELEATPWIWRVQTGTDALTGHTGLPAQALSAWMDEDGHLYLDSAMGLGRVHSQDMVHAAHWVELGAWVPQACESQELERHFGFVRSPSAHKKAGAGRL